MKRGRNCGHIAVTAVTSVVAVAAAFAAVTITADC